MFYSIRHMTKFGYTAAVRESVLELRMQPRTEGSQTVRNFQIVTSPRAQLFAYTDHFGNAVYHFNILREHSELRIDVQSVVEVNPPQALPPTADTLEWERYNTFNLRAEHYDFLGQSCFIQDCAELREFKASHGLQKPEGNTLSALRSLNSLIYSEFEYEPGVTEVHSPIDHALLERRGVCQDFAHIMIAISRNWGIPARYVSGYLFHRRQDHDRSGSDSTHAWVETWLPSFGWVGFDPTNNVIAGERHIRVAVGRDYADVPPTRGTFKGGAGSELTVAVSVEPTSAPIRHEELLRVARTVSAPSEKRAPPDREHQQQQQ